MALKKFLSCGLIVGALCLSLFYSVSADAFSSSNVVNITISAAGDCTLGTDANFSFGSSLPAKYNEVNDPGYFFGGVLPVFSEDDLTIVNMEGTLTNRGRRQDKTYAFRGDPSYTAILTSGSIEACNLANNHSKDYGQESYEDTVNYIEQAGITSFGLESVKVIDIKGIPVGLVGVYELPYGLSCKTALLDRIQFAKENGAKLIIVSFHWGTERMYTPEGIQVDLAHTAIDNGADLVIGHHPHVLQGIEKYKGKYIAYSLGNFCFGGNKNPSDKDTMIFQQTFTFKNNSLVENHGPQGIMRDKQVQDFENSSSFVDDSKIDSVNIIPCRLSSRTDINDYRPVVLEGDEAGRVLSKINDMSLPLN